MDVPLPKLFGRALSNAAKASNLPTIEDSTQVERTSLLVMKSILNSQFNLHPQDLIQSAISDLTTARNRVASLSLFSPNETLSDISSNDLIYLFVPFVLAEVENRARTTDMSDRMVRIGRAQVCLLLCRVSR